MRAEWKKCTRITRDHNFLKVNTWGCWKMKIFYGVYLIQSRQLSSISKNHYFSDHNLFWFKQNSRNINCARVLGPYSNLIFISGPQTHNAELTFLQEFRLSQPDDFFDGSSGQDPTLVFTKSGLPKSDEDWIKLVRKQEILHQLELEKWHQLLGTATQLLRQVRCSFVNKGSMSSWIMNKY